MESSHKTKCTPKKGTAGPSGASSTPRRRHTPSPPSQGPMQDKASPDGETEAGLEHGKCQGSTFAGQDYGWAVLSASRSCYKYDADYPVTLASGLPAQAQRHESQHPQPPALLLPARFSHILTRLHAPQGSTGLSLQTKGVAAVAPPPQRGP